MLMHEWEHLRLVLTSRKKVTEYAMQSHQFSYDTLIAVYQNLYASQMAQIASKTLKTRSQQIMNSYYAGKSLVDIAEELYISPILVTRKFLEIHFEIDPKSTKRITQLLRKPGDIEDPRLSTEVAKCVDTDEHCGPRVDRVKAAIGLEYEVRLLDEVRNLGIEFETENDLRARYSAKTPDVLLRVPVAFDGATVCWIDSKAKFGDFFNMRNDYQDSVSSYAGRFGPGLVIYWFGFIEDCDSPMRNDSGVLIRDRFPTDIIMLEGSVLPKE